MKAKEYLARLKTIDNLLRSLQTEIDDVENVRISSSGSMPDVPINGKGGTSDPVWRVAEEHERLLMELSSQRQAYVQIKTNAVRLIGMVDSQKYQTLLYQYYCKNKTLEATADYMGKSYQTICKWHGLALNEIQKIMDSEGIS